MSKSAPLAFSARASEGTCWGLPAAELGELLSLTTMTLCTCDADGQPHAAAVYFAADKSLQLFFYSRGESLHGSQLTTNPRAAATINGASADWKGIHGLQIHGDVRPLTAGIEREAAASVYRAKFPFSDDLADVLARNQLYCLVPTWLRMIDNRRSFGWKQEATFDV